jgi:uncharacterized pyridoxamine 5'-phosphate oxidase family protein
MHQLYLVTNQHYYQKTNDLRPKTTPQEHATHFWYFDIPLFWGTAKQVFRLIKQNDDRGFCSYSKAIQWNKTKGSIGWSDEPYIYRYFLKASVETD